MKQSIKLTLILIAIFFFISDLTVEAQLIRKLKKKVENKIDKETDKKIDDILNNKKRKSKEIQEEDTTTDAKKSNKNSEPTEESSSNKKSLKVWRNYKFIPGERVIFYDDLKYEEVGEFPSRWNLIKGGAEIVTFNGEKVIFGIPSAHTMNRIMPFFEDFGYLSDEFTIEYDIYVDEYTKEKNNNWGHYYVYFNSKHINGFLRPHIGLKLRYGKITGFASSQDFPIEPYNLKPNSWHHIAMSYHKGRFKLYINEKRVSNLPTFSTRPDIFVLEMSSNKPELRTAIKNIKIAHGGGQMYKRIMADGKYVTNGILFDTGKATIKPQSMGVINKIATIMNEMPEWKFQVIGHTDSDGSSEVNMLLSQQRAESVKNVLVGLGIKAERLVTIGKGETEPLNTNSSPEEKSNNRRVEFVKL